MFCPFDSKLLFSKRSISLNANRLSSTIKDFCHKFVAQRHWRSKKCTYLKYVLPLWERLIFQKTCGLSISFEKCITFAISMLFTWTSTSWAWVLRRCIDVGRMPRNPPLMGWLPFFHLITPIMGLFEAFLSYTRSVRILVMWMKRRHLLSLVLTDQLWQNSHLVLKCHPSSDGSPRQFSPEEAAPGLRAIRALLRHSKWRMSSTLQWSRVRRQLRNTKNNSALALTRLKLDTVKPCVDMLLINPSLPARWHRQRVG